VRILYSTTVLGDDRNLAVGRVPAGLTWNGAPIVDVVQFYRAANATVYGRADGPETFVFSVLAIFGSEADCLTFICTHRSALPLQADLLLTDYSTYALRLASAARSVNFGVRNGNTVPVQYSFTGARFLAEDVAANPERVVKLGTATLAADLEEIVVSFASAFDGAPNFCDLNLQPPPGYPAVAVVGYKDVSELGFTAILSAALPVLGYISRWMAEYRAIEESDTLKYGSITPDAADEEIAVVFVTAFGSEPRFPSLTLEPASGQPAVAVIGYKSISSAGFTAILAAAIPAAGYTARWKAEL